MLVQRDQPDQPDQPGAPGAPAPLARQVIPVLKASAADPVATP